MVCLINRIRKSCPYLKPIQSNHSQTPHQRPTKWSPRIGGLFREISSIVIRPKSKQGRIERSQAALVVFEKVCVIEVYNGKCRVFGRDQGNVSVLEKHR